MNIKITYNWLLDYLNTDATPQEIQKYLSLSGPSVERIEKVGDDWVFDIEVTSNRVDAASAFGIAQESQAILPQFGKKAAIKTNPLLMIFKALKQGQDKMLDAQIKDEDLCSRFAAIVLSNVKIDKSADFIQKRLSACGIKSINNVIDISNYLMLTLGQPTHVFDFDKIAKSQMILRESKKGEKITTLDKKEITLPGGDIVIEDGSRKLIDLCGIMGGLNSAVTNKTKNVVLFVQTYNGKRIRKTSMLTGQRTMAATYFEKQLDEERVEPTLVFGAELLEKYASARVASKLIDIYPSLYKGKEVTITFLQLENLIGVKIEKKIVSDVLSRLGFGVSQVKNGFEVSVPSFRKDDISIWQDLVEEVARIYGYHNLPSKLQPPAYVPQPKEEESLFTIQQKVKHSLKDLGLTEVMNYSMVSKEQIKNLGFEDKNYHLKIANPITEDLTHMRTSLLPSLIKNLHDNTGKKDVLRFFEIAKIYLPEKGSLPKEIYKLSLGVNTSFFDLKGIIEALFTKLNIENYKIRQGNIHLFSPNVQVNIISGNDLVGSFGELKSEFRSKNGLKSSVFLAGIRFQFLLDNYRLIPTYKPINPHAVIKLDLTAKIARFEEFKKTALAASNLLVKIDLIDMYKSNVTVRLYFSSNKRNITQDEAQKELEKIKKAAKLQ